MEMVDEKQVYHILQNLSDLEISYMEYSKSPKNFVKYQTYLDFFNNYIIKSRNLSRFYFPFPTNTELDINPPTYISELEEITDLITIVPGYDFAPSKQFNFPNSIRHKCNYFTCIYMLEGQGSLALDADTFNVCKGDFYILPPQVYYALETSADSICIYFNMRQQFLASEYEQIFQEDPVLTRFIVQALEPEHSMTYLAMHTDGNETINHFILMIFAEYINQNKYSNNAMKNYLSLLFVTILRDKDTIIDSSVKVTRIDRQYQQVVDYLRQNYQTATLSSTADHIHFSKQYVCKIVKQQTGNTFNHLLMGIRLDMVRQYLLETDLTLDNISYLSGFAAASHMSKVFKDLYGVSPSAYKKEHRQTVIK